jgi:hypothetical protein
LVTPFISTWTDSPIQEADNHQEGSLLRKLGGREMVEVGSRPIHDMRLQFALDETKLAKQGFVVRVLEDDGRRAAKRKPIGRRGDRAADPPLGLAPLRKRIADAGDQRDDRRNTLRTSRNCAEDNGFDRAGYDDVRPEPTDQPADLPQRSQHRERIEARIDERELARLGSHRLDLFCNSAEIAGADAPARPSRR